MFCIFAVAKLHNRTILYIFAAATTNITSMRGLYINKEISMSPQLHNRTTAQMGGSVIMYLWNYATTQPHIYRTMQLRSSVNTQSHNRATAQMCGSVIMYLWNYATTQPHNRTFIQTGGSVTPMLHISAFVQPGICAAMHLLNYTTAQPHN